MAYYCQRCDRTFWSEHAYQQHVENSSAHYWCEKCDRDFVSYHARRSHYIQSGFHHFCHKCDEDFESRRGLLRHFSEDHWYCGRHNTIFDSSLGLKEHYVQSPDHHYCQKCSQHFDDKNNLDQHLRSSTHQPKNVRCPGLGCGRSFVSHSALLLHFEAGNCPSGMTREELNRIVVQADRNNIITNPARLIAGPQGYQQPSATDYWATARSWNGSAYECFLCHGTFRSLQSLNAHLQSPTHRERIYRCPNQSCGIEYSVLSALCQHVENGSCGVSRFRAVRNALDSLATNMRLLTV
ncbi:hypothetical protein SISSUDRAFT_990851 [Sistotremastrum suecicum HHB10207 ss-3]|uniref:C2H2-type domain-containing protein n=1 Tax=Sistotremastrum suecicum HHB10207 ss-3 TaxID=1314776 RepID=A0A166ACM3_9AGAM|nr:hypothetical protein SISSUDRAFT_990851 [Sistotremastrum suecicum HHB10207 ss-3]